MTQWSSEDLDRIGRANELSIGTTRRDGTQRPYLPIWVVRLGEDLYVRAYRGRNGSWFGHTRRNPIGRIRAGGVERAVSFEPADPSVRASIDDAYRQKYGRGMYVDAMITPAAADATIKLVPAP